MKKAKSEKPVSMTQEIKDWKTGKARLRTSLLNESGSRTVWKESGPEDKVRRKRMNQLKTIRADLGLTQAQLASAMHVALKTLQGWEIGKPIPEVAFILAELLHDVPSVRKRLLAA